MNRRVLCALLSLVLAIVMLVPSGGSAVATAATVTVMDEANLRSGAGTSYSIVRVGHKGEKFEVDGTAKDASGRTWYKVRIGVATTAYVAGWLVSYAPASATAPATTPPSTPATSSSTSTLSQPAAASKPPSSSTSTAATRYAVAVEDGTSVRSGPGTSYTRLTTVKARTSLRILSEAKDGSGKVWYKVDCTSLKLKQTTGFVASWVVKVQSVSTPPSSPSTWTGSSLLGLWKPKLPLASRLTEAAVMREGPSVVYGRLASFMAGTAVLITGYCLNSQKETWCRITCQGTSGWVNASLLSSHEQIPAALMVATVGKNLVAADTTVKAVAAPLSTEGTGDAVDKGRSIVGVATDGETIFVQLTSTDSLTDWVAVTGTTTIGGVGPGGAVCSLTGIEATSSNGWTRVTMYVEGDKTGLSVVKAHNPERLEVSLPRLVQSAQAAISGIPTRQVSTVRVWATSAGFVSKVLIYLKGGSFTETHSSTGSTVSIMVSATDEKAAPKAVFLDNELLAGSEETFFADGATFVPLADLAARFGLLLSWDAVNQQTSLTIQDRQYVLKDGLRTLKIAQGTSHWGEEMAAPPHLLNGLLYVPVATAAHMFGLEATANAGGIYMDPVITSMTVSGTGATATVTLVSALPLHVSKVADATSCTFEVEGTSAVKLQGLQSLTQWASVSSQPRSGEQPPAVVVRVSAPVSEVKVGTPSPQSLVLALGAATSGKLAGRTIVVDPGHGSSGIAGTFDRGGTGPSGLTESAADLSIALKVSELLEAAGARVILTRTSEDSAAAPAADDRAVIVDSSAGDLLVSIHQSVAGHALDAAGTRTYYWAQDSLQVAERFQNALLAALDRPNLGVQRVSLEQVGGAPAMPAVLVECADIDTVSGERLLRSDAGQQKAAQAIVDAVIESLSMKG